MELVTVQKISSYNHLKINIIKEKIFFFLTEYLFNVGDGAPRGPPAYPEREPYDSYGSRPVHGYGNDYGPPPRPQTRYGSPLPDRYGRYEREIYDGRVDGPPPPGPPSRGPLYGPGPAPGGPGGPQQGSVVMIYGLAPDKINADRLFNLFCLYGNVVRVKFLKSKEGCAMIQMGDPLSVERTIANLNGVKFFGSKIQLGYSKQAFLNDVQQPFSLPDGSPSFKDFMGNRNNRFTNPESAGKNRIQPPSKILHFFNAPYGIKEEELKKGKTVSPPLAQTQGILQGDPLSLYLFNFYLLEIDQSFKVVQMG
ncbi:heterogeneous nuclear ribonucleoprotein L-like [Centruroides vittatus]|uniref:heterogeneous nuclear ribonucleoprotein L-like n=1 Tax=Centruroides vittatus TaxID=120091 RepID=UPI00350FCB55